MAWTETPNLQLPLQDAYGGSWLEQWNDAMAKIDTAFMQPVATLSAGANAITAANFNTYHRSPAGNCTATIGNVAVADHVLGAVMYFRQTDAGVVTIATATGVTVNLPYGAEDSVTRGEGDTVMLKCVARNEWDMVYLGGAEVA